MKIIIGIIITLFSLPAYAALPDMITDPATRDVIEYLDAKLEDVRDGVTGPRGYPGPNEWGLVYSSYSLAGIGMAFSSFTYTAPLAHRSAGRAYLIRLAGTKPVDGGRLSVRLNSDSGGKYDYTEHNAYVHNGVSWATSPVDRGNSTQWGIVPLDFNVEQRFMVEAEMYIAGDWAVYKSHCSIGATSHYGTQITGGAAPFSTSIDSITIFREGTASYGVHKIQILTREF